jgi:hypothetical protein
MFGEQLVFGGLDNDRDVVYGRTWLFSETTFSWRLIENGNPPVRSGALLDAHSRGLQARFGHKIAAVEFIDTFVALMYGGCTAADGRPANNDMWLFHAGVKIWIPLVPSRDSQPPPRLAYATFAKRGGHPHVIFAGGTDTCPNFFQSTAPPGDLAVWRFNMDTLIWTRILTGADPQHGSAPSVLLHASFIYGSRLLIAGGYKSYHVTVVFQPSSQLWMLQLDGDDLTGNWTLVQNDMHKVGGPNAVMSEAGLRGLVPYARTDNVTVVFSLSADFVATTVFYLYALNLTTWEWSRQPMTGTPLPRSLFAGGTYEDGSFVMFGGRSAITHVSYVSHVFYHKDGTSSAS